MAKTPAERKADERKRKRAAGLVQVQEWVMKPDVDKLKKYAAKLRNGK